MEIYEDKSHMHRAGLLKAIRYFGSQVALAKRLNISQQSVNHWLNRENKMPYVQALMIVALSKGTVRLNELAPQETWRNIILQPFLDMRCHCKEAALDIECPKNIKSTLSPFIVDWLKKHQQYKATLEKELTEKKKAWKKTFSHQKTNILLKEEELKCLRAHAAEFQHQLLNAVAQTEKTITDTLHCDYEEKLKFLQNEIEEARHVHEQSINALEAKIKQPTQYIQSRVRKILSHKNSDKIQCHENH